MTTQTTSRHPSEPTAAIAVDYGGTISASEIDHLIGQKPVDPAAVEALSILHDGLGLKLILVSNTAPHETRWAALQKAGVDRLFSVALLSYSLGVSKPSPVYYRLVVAAAQVAPEQVLFVGDNLACDVLGPVSSGMRAALVRPHGLQPGEVIPEGTLLIRHICELPGLLEES